MQDIPENASKGHHVRKWIKIMLAEGHLREVPPNCAQVITKHYDVKKKGTKDKRIVGNFVQLNNITVPEAGLKIDALQLVKMLARLKYKAKLDLKAGFYTARVHPVSQKFLGLKHDNKYYVYNSMPMGTKNSPAVFSKFVPYIFLFSTTL